MEQIAFYEDDLYPKTTITHARITTRAIVLNENDELALIHVVGEDDFGMRDHYETCGGGVEENETLEEAILREVREELGYDGEIVDEIGMIVDHYNFLQRQTQSHYFVVRINSEMKEKENRTEAEKVLFKEIIWVNVDEAMEKLSNQNICLIGRLIHRRDLCALLYYISIKES